MLKAMTTETLLQVFSHSKRLSISPTSLLNALLISHWHWLLLLSSSSCCSLSLSASSSLALAAAAAARLPGQPQEKYMDSLDLMPAALTDDDDDEMRCAGYRRWSSCDGIDGTRSHSSWWWRLPTLRGYIRFLPVIFSGDVYVYICAAAFLLWRWKISISHTARVCCCRVSWRFFVVSISLYNRV